MPGGYRVGAVFTSLPQDVATSASPTFVGETLTGAETLTAGAGTAAVALRIGKSVTEGLERKVIDETVTATNAVSIALTAGAIPAGAVVLSAQAVIDTTLTGDGTGDGLLARVGIGISSSKAKYGATADMVKNTKLNTIPAHAVNAGETILLYGLKADGTTAATEKFTAGGKVRVHIVYEVATSLDNVA